MTNEEILKQVIKNVSIKYFGYGMKTEPLGVVLVPSFHFCRVFVKWRLWDDPEELDLMAFIFSHNFAKAFWGTKSVNKGKWKLYEEWQGYLQRMVLEKDPIKYLEKFL